MPRDAPVTSTTCPLKSMPGILAGIRARSGAEIDQVRVALAQLRVGTAPTPVGGEHDVTVVRRDARPGLHPIPARRRPVMGEASDRAVGLEDEHLVFEG